MMEKNRKYRTPQETYDELIYMINNYIAGKDATEYTIELLDELVEKLMDGDGWQG